jgi:acetyl-CoA C-acetyltransferase
VNLDPRTPVIVGVGQSIERPTPDAAVSTRPSPQSLMQLALERAMADASPSARWRLDELVAVNSLSWPAGDPARLVADALGLSVARTRKTPTGGDLPQRLVHDGARRILAGEIETMAIAGVEAVHTAARARKLGETLAWFDAPATPAAEMTGEETVPFTESETASGLMFPTEFYPLFENARRARRGWSLDEQRRRLGELWARFAAVAATNPYAWITTAPGATEIATASADNRMVGFPYTKRLVANLPVDMGACVILTSYAEARRLGVARDRMVFPQAGAHAHDHWFVSEREALDDSPAMREIWRALGEFGVRREQLAHLDLYSCFPTVVQTAAEVLGVDPFTDPTELTVTGGLTFAGGPGNNYVTHSIAAMVERLRADPSSRGLVTGVGWFSTKHAWGVYGAEPPTSGFGARDVQPAVDALPVCSARQDDGAVTVESYVVSHRHDGSAKRLVAAARLDDGARAWCRSEDAELMARFETVEMIGTRARVRNGHLEI